jgi:hypothetical protein
MIQDCQGHQRTKESGQQQKELGQQQEKSQHPEQ